MNKQRSAESMQLLNSIDIDTPQGTRSFELWHGDVTNLHFAADLLIISVVQSDFSPVIGTVVAALSSKLGISVESLSKQPDLDFIEPFGRLWVSKVVDQNRIGRIMCVEIPYGGINASQIVQQAFRSLPMLEARGVPLNTICLPMLGTGSHKLAIESVLQPILNGARWALHVLGSADRICFVEINMKRAKELSEAMDTVLGRVKVAIAKGAFAEAIRTEIRNQLEKLEQTDSRANRVVERLRRAISDGSRSADVGMAGRLLREYVVDNILSPDGGKKLAAYEITQELRKQRVAEWVISYLELLRSFGNEAAHHKTQNTLPPEIDGRDMAVCLFAIQRVLDFWFSLRLQH
jgi:hypothetical protein